MDRDRLAQALLATFLEELEGHVASLNRDLLALEREQGTPRAAERVAALLRTLHSVKGAARAASALLVETACHRLEEVLEPLRDGRTASPELYELCFAAVDALDDAGRRLASKQELAGSPLDTLLPDLERAANGDVSAPHATGTTPHAPGATRPPGATDESSRAPGASAARSRAPGSAAEPSRAAGAAPESSRMPGASAESSRMPGSSAESSRMPGSSAESSAPESPPTSPVLEATLPVRVSAQKLDALLSRSGELRVASLRLEGRTETLEGVREELARMREAVQGTEAESSLRRAEKELARVTRELAADQRTLSGVATGMDDEVRRARTLPFLEGCEGLERAARDVARSEGKKARLEVHGGALELDRSLLQSLREPMLHLVRNAVAHGLESPEERRRAHKPEEGRVTLSARLRGSRVEVTVEDDGRGLNLEALRARAVAQGIEAPEDDEDAARLAFHSGLSTSTRVTEVAGRGVGLDVVRTQVEAMRGTVEVSTLPGQGARFALDVPLTLSTLRVLLVSAGGQILALASEGVARLVRLSPDEVRDVEGRPTWVAEDALVPLASLADVLGLPPGPPRQRRGAVVLAAGTARAALVVDEVLAEQEALVRALGPRVRRARHVSAAAVLPDGRLSLLLNPVSLVRAAGGRPSTALFPAPVTQRTRRRIVLADDSPTTRALEQSILEGAGYDVVPCVDGAEAWERLQAGGAEALVLDVEMPRMDGIALTEAVRASPRFARLPVILVTARGRPEDKARGLQAGASAYLVKSAFDPTSLLETLRRLL
ncbi:hybrid sensor histidine kinase/response regulator [Myxococcus sp. CA051A]|uniref:hybrid sensor histidine kinase/response regulator n=1 Tax=unclassified Myxococcus TaxID=2648731 RepID=UPI00157A80C6|nr:MULTISPECIES: hybrid sensor histidine kinase/response regulator [unclassified Myxococcus]NTX11152.1 hybrid sensor histidine kinase/response regulator [Myxococcus sp. CA056]NTX60420.1 hybrid sensor histidine kinase/response regulator [Myxococcus sp. CA051A]